MPNAAMDTDSTRTRTDRVGNLSEADSPCQCLSPPSRLTGPVHHSGSSSSWV